MHLVFGFLLFVASSLWWSDTKTNVRFGTFNVPFNQYVIRLNAHDSSQEDAILFEK